MAARYIRQSFEVNAENNGRYWSLRGKRGRGDVAQVCAEAATRKREELRAAILPRFLLGFVVWWNDKLLPGLNLVRVP